jgi:hypothetical protein
MGKLKTNLVNETNKTLELFEETSSRPQIRRCRLTPKGDPNPNITLETSTSNPPHTNIVGESNYLVECEPNQTYWGLRVWCNNKAVLYVTGDELIDNSVITILCDTQNHEFTKHCEQRLSKKPSPDKLAATPAADAQDPPTEGAPLPRNTNALRRMLRCFFKTNKS